MSHFAYTRVGGAWSALTNLLASETQDLDVKTFKAINGDDGGTWAPASPLVIGGAGINVTGPTVLTTPPTYTAPLTVTKFVPSVTFMATASWAATVSYTYPYFTNSTASPGNLMLLLGGLPPGMVISSISLSVAGNAMASLPAVMPSITFNSSPPYPPAVISLGTATDASGTLGAYNAGHLLTLSGLSATVVSTNMYWLTFTPGSGGGAAAGFFVGLVQVSGTLPVLRNA